MRRRRGFVLVAVLWLLVLIGVAGVTAALEARTGFDSGRNRVHETQARWLAAGCLSRARLTIDEILDAAPDPLAQASRWRALERLVAAELPDEASCRVRLEAAGTRLDVNGADTTQLARLFRAAGAADAAALATAIVAWRSRNGPFAHERALLRVPGMSEHAELLEWLSAEPGKTCVATAPALVLASIPGFTAPLVAHVVESRGDAVGALNLLGMASAVSPEAADSVMAHFAEITEMSVLEPEAWVVTATSGIGTPRIESSAEQRIVRASGRSAATRQRSR